MKILSSLQWRGVYTIVRQLVSKHFWHTSNICLVLKTWLILLGFYPHEDNCVDFYVCLEVLPGVLLAEQVYKFCRNPVENNFF